MNKRYNTLGYMIMQILANYSSCGFPMSYSSELQRRKPELLH